MVARVIEVLFLDPDDSANLRTKNRIREHGSQGFVLKKVSLACHALGNCPAMWVHSLSTGWDGWLRSSMVIVAHKERRLDRDIHRRLDNLLT